MGSEELQSENSASQTPGAILRRCREFHAITLEDAAAATKIGKNYLRALEEDRYHEFPSTAYLKGFLRNYAVYLGLNAEDLVRMLVPEQTGAPQEEPRSSRRSMEPRQPIWQRLWLSGALLAIIILLALVMRHGEEPASHRPPPSVASSAPPVQQIRSSLVQPSTAQPGPSGGTPTASPSPSVQPAPGGVTLRIKALRKGALVVTLDDATTQSYDLTPGDLIEWRADRDINLELSDPAAVEMDLNGRPLRPPLPPGSPATLMLDAQGVRK